MDAFYMSTIHNLTIEPVNDLNINLRAFGYSDIYNVTFEEGLTNIPDYLFYSAKLYCDIVIPEGVTHIGKRALAFDTINTGASLTLPSTLKTIEEKAFSTSMRNLGNLYFNGSIAEWCNIKADTYDAAPLLYATSCKFYINGNEELPSVLKVPEGVTYVSKYAFANRTNITDIYLPLSIQTIDSGAIKGCSSLANIYYAGTEEQWNSVLIGDSNTTSATPHFETSY